MRSESRGRRLAASESRRCRCARFARSTPSDAMRRSTPTSTAAFAARQLRATTRRNRLRRRCAGPTWSWSPRGGQRGGR
eukprot:6669764-Lingulodinium_polyedra.AAC.1